jgi:hypothetical protein
VFRRLITLAVAAALFAVLVPAALAVRVHVRVEGKTTTIYGPTQPMLDSGPTALAAPIAADQAAVKDGDTVLWYWTTFTEQGGSPTLLLRRRAARNCYSVFSQDDAGKTTPASGATLIVDRRRVTTRSGRGCVGRHRGLVRATAAHAVRSNALR